MAADVGPAKLIHLRTVEAVAMVVAWPQVAIMSRHEADLTDPVWGMVVVDYDGWARMTGLPLSVVMHLAPTIMESGIVAPDGTVADDVKTKIDGVGARKFMDLLKETAGGK